MHVGGVVIGAKGGGGISCVCVMGGVLEKGGDGKVTYEGGLRKCMLVKEEVGVKEVQRMVLESIGGNFSEHKICYSMKHDRQILMPIEADLDSKMIFNGNEEHRYLYGRQ